MAKVRIGLATPQFATSVDDAMEHVQRHVEDASARGAAIICFPESYVPGLRGMGEVVPAHDQDAQRRALERARALAREHRLAIILPMDWDHPDSGRGFLNVAMVIDATGEVLGHQSKNQLDPTEDDVFIAGESRKIFQTAGLTFGITICHEGFRYPESVRWAARRGASIVFHPHCTGNNHQGRRPSQWQEKGGAYYEHAIMCRALENTIYFASINYAFKYQESATSLIAPDGELLAHQPYGVAGVLIAELDTERATGLLARRFSPAQYEQG